MNEFYDIQEVKKILSGEFYIVPDNVNSPREILDWIIDDCQKIGTRNDN